MRRDHTAHGLLIHSSTYLRQHSVADTATASRLLPSPPSGFPLLFLDTPDPAVAIKYEAQGMVGGDFECSGTLIPGMCAISSLVVALPTCINSFAGTCTAVVVYTRGMDGCSEEIAVLKQTRLVPFNSFMSPTGEGGVRLIRKACCPLPERVRPPCILQRFLCVVRTSQRMLPPPACSVHPGGGGARPGECCNQHAKGDTCYPSRLPWNACFHGYLAVSGFQDGQTLNHSSAALLCFRLARTCCTTKALLLEQVMHLQLAQQQRHPAQAVRLHPMSPPMPPGLAASWLQCLR